MSRGLKKSYSRGPRTEIRSSRSRSSAFRCVEPFATKLGRPAAQAWVGENVELWDDVWKPIPADRIRDRREPFRDDQGKVVPPGESGNTSSSVTNGGTGGRSIRTTSGA